MRKENIMKLLNNVYSIKNILDLHDVIYIYENYRVYVNYNDCIYPVISITHTDYGNVMLELKLQSPSIDSIIIDGETFLANAKTKKNIRNAKLQKLLAE